MNKKVKIAIIAVSIIIIIALLMIITGAFDKGSTGQDDYKVSETESGTTIEMKDENGEVHTITIAGKDGEPEFADMDAVDQSADTGNQEKKADPAESGSKKAGTTGKAAVGTYEWYIGLSSEKQYEYYKDFKKPEDFFQWYDKARKEYDSKQQVIKVDSGDVIQID